MLYQFRLSALFLFFRQLKRLSKELYSSLGLNELKTRGEWLKESLLDLAYSAIGLVMYLLFFPQVSLGLALAAFLLSSMLLTILLPTLRWIGLSVFEAFINKKRKPQ